MTDADVPPEVPFPQYSVGLLQSESEIVQVPEFDLFSFLEADPRWSVELYTERNVTALLGSADRFDCIVVGYNAAYKSPQIREALHADVPGVGLCVLHQLKPEAVTFLTDDVGLRLEPLGPAVEPVVVAADVEPRDEILLNWPEATSLDGERPSDAGAPARALRHSVAHVGLVPAPGTRWRTVLEAQSSDRRLPVLVRTETARWPPLVVSTALLAPRHEAHAALLINMLLWCVSGRPSAVVVETPSRPDASALHRKMRLQGTRAIARRLESETELDFERWPFRGIASVLLPEGWDPTAKEGWPERDPHNARRWMSRGGRIAVLRPDDVLTVRHGESDAHWVAARWAAWFHSIPPATWHGGYGDRTQHAGGIVATRAVLRVLAALRARGPGPGAIPGVLSVRRVRDELDAAGHWLDPESLGLPPPAAYLEPVRRLLHQRIGDAHHVDGTVSATVAALDIDVLLGGEALGARHADLESWLRDGFEEAALEDKLEIARALRDPEMLELGVEAARTGGRLDSPLSAVLVTALRTATVACELTPALAVAGSITRQRAVVRRELHMGPLLAANYLLGLSDLQTHWRGHPDSESHLLARPSPETVDRAVITIGKQGPLLSGDPRAAGAAPDVTSTEALAMIAYFGRHRSPTHVIGGVGTVPPQMLTSVLQEAEALRRENEERVRDEATVRLAAKILALAGEIVVVAVLVLAWWLIAVNTDVAFTWEVATFSAAWAFGTLALLAGLHRLRLRPAQAGKLVELLRGGLSGVRERFARAAGGQDEPERRPDAP